MVLSNMNKTFTALYPNNKQSINVGRGVKEKHVPKSGRGSQNCNLSLLDPYTTSSFSI